MVFGPFCHKIALYEWSTRRQTIHKVHFSGENALKNMRSPQDGSELTLTCKRAESECDVDTPEEGTLRAACRRPPLHQGPGGMRQTLAGHRVAVWGNGPFPVSPHSAAGRGAGQGPAASRHNKPVLTNVVISHETA